ncbi:MAG TPA: hypothetical protein VH208_00490 [Myxococcaceae bacterium]|nr:hypothetical protein [Myxococcaceae bacterium]
MPPVIEDARTHKLGQDSDAKWLLAQVQWYCWRKARSPLILREALEELCRAHQLPERAIDVLLEPRDQAGAALFLAAAAEPGYVVLVDYWWERQTSTARVNAHRERQRDLLASREPTTAAAVADATLFALASPSIETVSNGFKVPAAEPVQEAFDTGPAFDPIAMSARPPDVPTVLRKGAPVPEAWVQAIYDMWEETRRTAFSERAGTASAKVRRRYLSADRRKHILAALRRGRSLEECLAAVQGWVHELGRGNEQFDRLQQCEIEVLLRDKNIDRFSEWHWDINRPGPGRRSAPTPLRQRPEVPEEDDAWERAAVRVGAE